MAICRKARAALASRIQADKALGGHGIRAVLRTLLMALDMRTGRCKLTYDQLASQAGCDRSTVRRAMHHVERYFEIVRTWVDRPGRNGGVVRGRGCNLYIVRDLPTAEAEKPAQGPEIAPVSLQGQDALGTTSKHNNKGRSRVIHTPVDILTGLDTALLSLSERLTLRSLLRKVTATA